MNTVNSMSAVELSRQIQKGNISVKEVLNSFLKATEKYDGILHCYNTVCAETAEKRAGEIQKGIENGRYRGRLAGVPIAIKDNICTKGIATTCSSGILKNFVPFYNASVIESIYDGGMLVTGKLNMDEFAMGSTTQTSVTGATKNPWDLNRVAGGSSGGSAAAVAAGLVPLSLGTDTGGSIRQPCSFCGVSGLKPTYSAVSRYGLIAYASSLDQIGPVGRCVEDCAALFELICGPDSKDSTSAKDYHFDFEQAVKGEIKGKKIGIPKEYMSGDINEEVKSAILNAADIFKSLGASVEYFDLPLSDFATPAYYIIACAEASSNLARFDGVKYGCAAENCGSLDELYVKSRSQGFSMETKRRIMLGNFVLSSGYYEQYYMKALKAQSLISKAFDKAFERFDIILAPVAPATAWGLGEKLDNPVEMYLSDIYTVTVNLAGLPAFAMPCGFDQSGLPVGMQLIGRRFCEAEILGAAKAFEGVTEYHKAVPKLVKEGSL